MYKDVAKWLMGFVPVTTFLTLALALGPSADQISSAGLRDWIASHIAASAWAVAILGATALMIAMCGRVLLAEPTKWDELWGTDHAKWRVEAFNRHAVGRPHFYDPSAFRKAELACHAKPDDPRSGAVEATTTRIVTLSADLNAATRLKQFMWVFGFGVLTLVVGALAITATTSPSDEIVTAPAVVVLHIPADQTSDFEATTGCSDSTAAVAVAVSGTAGEPVFRLYGDGCGHGRWTEADFEGLVVTPK